MDFKWSNTLKSSDVTILNNSKTVSIQGGWAVTEDNMTSGKYYFELIINKYTQIVIGVAQAITTATKPTEAQVRAMFGFDGNKVYPRSAYGTSYNTSNTMGIAIDMDKGEISFVKDGLNLGVAFDNLKSLGELKLYVSTTTGGGSETLTIVDDINSMKHRDVAVNFLYNNRMTLKNQNTGKQFSINDKELVHLSDSSQDAILKYGIKQSTTVNLDAPFTSHLYPTTVANKMSTVNIGQANSITVKEPIKPWAPLVTWHETKMTSNTTPSPLVASASSSYSSDYLPFRAFDNSLKDLPSGGNNTWITSNNVVTGWIQLDFGMPTSVNVFNLTPRQNASANVGIDAMPKKFNLLGSNDSINYDTIKSYNNESWSSHTQSRQFILDSTVKYRYYKLDILENNGGSLYVAIGEIAFGNKREVN